MISQELQKARVYEEANMHLVPEAERPKFHVTGAIGWINDPNGFSVYKNEYHLFFQYHPYSTNWGPMHWGHVKTKDFVTWERLPVALAPDKDYDSFGCFSGTGLELPDERHLLIYTSVYERKNEDGVPECFQQQSIAIGDGVDYEKIDCNPVIRTNQIPLENSKYDFRDPKIYKKDGLYYVVIANCKEDGQSEILRYKSKDLKNFEFDCLLYEANPELGKMWECPDYFELDGRMVLMASPQEMKASGFEFIDAKATVFLVGDELDGQFKESSLYSCDYGIDFYAPQTLMASDGRRIMIAWMQAWESTDFDNESRQIYGAMTLPRELRISNGRVHSVPVRELNDYHKDKIEALNLLVSDKQTKVAGIKGRVFDMSILLKGDFEKFAVNLACDAEHKTSINVDKLALTITLDRSKCGNINEKVLALRTFAIEDFEELKLRIIMDKNSIELFVNDGEKTATMLTYADLDAADISFTSIGQAIADIDFYTLNV